MDMMLATMIGLGALAVGKATLGKNDGVNAGEEASPGGTEFGAEPGERDDRGDRGERYERGRGSSRDTMKRLRGVMTPARQDYFERAMREKASREVFYRAAEGFDRAGLPLEARMLRARGDARAASPEVHEKRREMIRKAFQSRDPDKVEAFANVAETKLGMTVTAGKLREYAQGLRQAMAARGPDGGASWTSPTVGASYPDGSPYTFENRDVARGAGLNAGSERRAFSAEEVESARMHGLHERLAEDAPQDPAARGQWLPSCPLNVGGECIVHGVGGCIVEGVDRLASIPSLEETTPDPETSGGWGSGR